MQTLGAVKQYLNDYVRDRESRGASRARADAARAGAEAQLAAKDAYNSFYRTEAAKLFQSLPTEERGAIEALARSRTPSYASTPGTMAEPFFLLNRDRITAQRYPGSIPPFDEWRMGGQTRPQR
jgi:hypothetical protein